jgi:hypothetical protein
MAESHATSPDPHRRKSSSLQRIPWLAATLLLVVLVCIGASAGIIVFSDKRTVASLKVQPTVLLAILSSVLNFALGITFSTSVAITWWRSAIQGTSLARLHYIWNRGEGLCFFSALAAGSDARKVVLAAATIAMVKFVNNPLLQRATHIRAQDIVTSDTIALNITQMLPEGWLGTIVNASSGSVIGSRNGLATAQAWWRNDTITTLNAPGYYCDGTCEGNVQGAGISYNCSSTTQALDLSTGEGKVIFAINTTMSQNSTGAPFLLLTTLHSSAVDDSCIATLTIDTCNIEAGVVEYPVTIQNSTVTLNYDKLNHVTVLSTHVYPGDLPTAAPFSLAGTLQGLNDFYGYYLFATTTVATESTYSGSSMLADMFFDADPSSFDNHTLQTCGLKWASPTEYVLNSMQDFMFRAAMRASNSTAEVQTFTAQRTSPALIFHSEYSYLAAALAVMLLALFVVLFLLQGLWELGRTVSLSPLETAKAFCAPVMKRAGQKSTANEILKDIGQISVRYVDGKMVWDDGDVIQQGTEQQDRQEG